MTSREFTIHFHARKKGAIGIFQAYARTVLAKDRQEAILSLYDEFDHVHVNRVEG